MQRETQNVEFKKANHGCPPPAYDVSAGDPGDIMVRIDAAPDAILSAQGDTQNDKRRKGTTGKVAMPHETVNETVKAVFSLVVENPGIKMPELVARTGRSRATVARTLASLQRKDKIQYRGSDKTGGYYAITNREVAP